MTRLRSAWPALPLSSLSLAPWRPSLPLPPPPLTAPPPHIAHHHTPQPCRTPGSSARVRVGRERQPVHGRAGKVLRALVRERPLLFVYLAPLARLAALRGRRSPAAATALPVRPALHLSEERPGCEATAETLPPSKTLHSCAPRATRPTGLTPTSIFSLRATNRITVHRTWRERCVMRARALV